MVLELWDRLFTSIYLLGLNQFINRNTQNIACSLHRITSFIKQQFLSNETANNILAISKFGLRAWELLRVIYESRWDKLIPDQENNYSFLNCVLVQFTPKCKYWQEDRVVKHLFYSSQAKQYSEYNFQDFDSSTEVLSSSI